MYREQGKGPKYYYKLDENALNFFFIGKETPNV